MQDLLYQIALTNVPNIGAVQAKILVNRFDTAEDIFRAPKKELETIEGIGEVRAKSIKDYDGFADAETEIEFIEKYRITPLFLKDKNYPQRLLHCYDSPTLLYYRGNADLNASKVISIIGTRNNTEYGKLITDQLIEELQTMQVLIVSGLAYGIDALAHKAAVSHNLPTVGVLAHGLDKIYPPQHTGLAKQMLLNGGLLTEFKKDTKADKHNFPRRNRIVAGIADCTIVIETAAKGGSMITAELANGYNRDVFAYPGKVTDSKSSGCNYLIKTNKATLLTDAEQLIDAMGWATKKTKAKKQKELFIELSQDEKVLVDLLKEKESIHIDELFLKSGLNSSTVAA
ncbi:MAG TPA: DNA-processing protein DprA, partial [Segetibacter sp.]